MRARKLIVAGAAMAAGLMLFSVPAQVVQPIPTVAADSQYNIHGITRSMAVQWAWWHFYTANNGVHNDIKINNQTFFARSNWTKHHKRIIVWIYRRGTGHNDPAELISVYRVSTAGNLKIRNDAESFSSGGTVWNIVSRHYQTLSTDAIAGTTKLDYNTITPQETAAAIMYYAVHRLDYDRTILKDGHKQGGFELSQHKVKDVSEPGRGVMFSIIPKNAQEGSFDYTVDAKGNVYFYGPGSEDPVASANLKQMITYENNMTAVDNIRAIAGTIDTAQ